MKVRTAERILWLQRIPGVNLACDAFGATAGKKIPGWQTGLTRDAATAIASASAEESRAAAALLRTAHSGPQALQALEMYQNRVAEGIRQRLITKISTPSSLLRTTVKLVMARCASPEAAEEFLLELCKELGEWTSEGLEALPAAFAADRTPQQIFDLAKNLKREPLPSLGGQQFASTLLRIFYEVGYSDAQINELVDSVIRNDECLGQETEIGDAIRDNITEIENHTPAGASSFDYIRATIDVCEDYADRAINRLPGILENRPGIPVQKVSELFETVLYNFSPEFVDHALDAIPRRLQQGFTPDKVISWLPTAAADARLRAGMSGPSARKLLP
ncbi:hypothetical protein ACFL31_00725 [Candidatus Margulisiibacteriota bacterium]